MNDVLDRLAATAPPDRTVLIGCAVVAVALLVVAEVAAVVRHFVTLLHEGGHAIVALMAGRSLHGIRLHSDSSGLSISRGRARGPGMVFTLLAGYLTPPLVGLVGAFAVTTGWSNAYLWAVVLLCVLLLIQMRNLHGLGVVLLSGVSIGLITWFGTDAVRSALAATLSCFLLLSGPWGMWGLWKARRQRGGLRSDVDQLAAITPVPAGLWWVLMMLLCLAFLAIGAARLWTG